MREPLLQLIGVTRRFRAGDHDMTVLRDVDLTIEAGEFVAIVGASGSGKSTLMNILGCLDRPSTGCYKVGGVDTSTLPHDELARLRREHFGFIFQRYHLLPHASAAANVEMPAIYTGMPREARRLRAQASLARLGLADRGAHRPAQLSGGQQQRVSIARALMNGGDVILADEPTGALDSASGEEVIAVLRELNTLGHTVIVVTHDEHVASHAGRIVEISDGVIVRDRMHRQPVVMRREAHEETQQQSNWGDEGTTGVAVRERAPQQSPAILSEAHQEAQQSTRKADTTTGDRANANPAHQRFTRGRTAALARFAEAFNMAWSALLSHRLRTLLTMLGIVIGITSVVSIVAIGEGAKRYMLEEISRIGTNTIQIYPGRDWGDSFADSIQSLVPADADALREEQYVDSVTPFTSRSLLLRYRNVDVDARVSGVGESYFQVGGHEIATGIAFGADEVRRYAQVAVIDSNTRRKLFGANVNPLGKVILIDNVPCVVIGVVADRHGSFFIDTKSLNVWVPYTTASARLFGQRHLEGIAVRVRAGQPSEAAEQGIVELLTRRHGRKDFFTYNLDSVVKTMNTTGRALALLLSLIAVVSLVVGGIGVMNIMLVSVTERTREIGIRMAVGARRSDVMCQFLVEAVLVCLMGGAVGIAVSFAASFVFSSFVDKWQMVFSTNTVIAAVASSTLIGVVFGFVPARNAARLDPIVALARD